MLLNSKIFSQIAKRHSSFSGDRRQIQSVSSEVLGASKRSIFAMQRGDAKTAAMELEKAKEELKKGRVIIKKRKRMEQEGIWRSCMEEYAEAWMYHQVMTGHTLTAIPDIDPDDTEVYLGGLSDLTGELVRSCVLLATEHKKKDVERLVQSIREAVAFLIKLDLAGNLRQKYDQAKQNLRKAEEIAMDLAMHS
jgi:predicted translin family RNA/ssDNA-binding protein